MDPLANEILYSKQIIENVFLFHNIYEQYLNNREEPENFFPPSDEFLPIIPQNITEQLNSLINEISEKMELLNKSEQFNIAYQTHYNEKEDLLHWTFGKNGIEQLVPISVYIFIKKCQLKCGHFIELFNPFSKICKNFSLDLITRLFNSNEGNIIMIWKTITFILILNKPNQDITAEENNSIKYPTSNNYIIKLSHGLHFDEITENSKILTIVLNKKTVTPFLLSPVLLEAYSTILSEVKCKETTDKNQIKERIQKEIEDFLTKDSIYFIYNMFQRGLTLADGSVLINYQNTDDVGNAACCLMTIFHEMTHVLLRKIIYTNTFRRSFDETEDLGNKVKECLVGELNQCHKKGCYFLLNLKNYQLCDLKTFKSRFTAEEKNCIKKDINDSTKTYVIDKKTKKRASCVMSL